MADDEAEITWWKTLLAGLAFLGLGLFLFWYFSDLEEKGGVRVVRWWVALIYKIGGKWTVGVFFGLLSLVCFYLTFKQLRGSNDE